MTDAADLPDLTERQHKFVEGLLSGKTASDAYRAAYDCSGMAASTLWAEASRLKADHKVSAWLQAAREDHLSGQKVTLTGHIAELERLKRLAVEGKNFGAAVRAEELKGKAAELYIERHRDETIRQPADIIDEIAVLIGEDRAKLLLADENNPQ